MWNSALSENATGALRRREHLRNFATAGISTADFIIDCHLPDSPYSELRALFRVSLIRP